jgi:peroxiredoxin
MKKGMLCVVSLMLCMTMSGLNVLAGRAPSAKGEQLPDISLKVPEDQAQKEYLGLQGNGMFKVPQIMAKVVVIEIFSMYCPYCQREAPNVNSLYRKIEDNPKLRGKVKLIGIGAGNSPFEVDVFRKKYEVPFPLFSDENYALYQCLGEVRTPYFFAAKINPDGTTTVLYSQLGGLHGADRFLESILDLSSLKKER